MESVNVHIAKRLKIVENLNIQNYIGKNYQMMNSLGICLLSINHHFMLIKSFSLCFGVKKKITTQGKIMKKTDYKIS